MKRVLSASALAIVCMLGISSCNSSNPIIQENNQSATVKNDLSFKMNIPQSVSISLEKPVISVYNGDSLLTELVLTKDGSTISGIIKSLPVGKELTFVLVLYGQNGNALYEGSTVGTLNSKTTTQITIALKAKTGSAEIIGVFEDDTTTTGSSKIVISGNSSVEETYVFKGSSFSDKNYGVNPWIFVGNYSTDGVASSLIQFNLGANYSADNIASASMVLELGRWETLHFPASDSFEVSVYSAMQGWTEGKGGSPVATQWEGTINDHTTWTGLTNSSTVNGATAIESQYGMAWKSMYGTNPVTTFKIPYGIGEHQTIRVDITSLVKDWVSNPSTNFGIVMRETDESGSYNAFPMFMSSENDRLNAKGPALEITLK